MLIQTEKSGSIFPDIPHSVHQTWKTRDVPSTWLANSDSWKALHPTHQWRCWSDEDILDLVREQEPGFLSVFTGFPRTIQRVDAAKVMIMFHEGGIYADLDTTCHRNTLPLVAQGGAVLSRTKDGVMDGAFMASSPGHPLWRLALEEMRHPPVLARILRHVPGLQASYVLFSTGPFMLRRVARRYTAELAKHPDLPGLTVLNERYCSATSWWKRSKPTSVTPDTFVQHHYADSWLLPMERLVTRAVAPRSLLMGAAILVIGSLLVNGLISGGL